MLFVDDEPDARELVKRVLMECEAKSRPPTPPPRRLSGSSGIFDPDVIVSDIGMPEMDGYEFLRRHPVTSPTPAAAKLPRSP